jgi:CRISPR-associated endoribonuclease Cas6
MRLILKLNCIDGNTICCNYFYPLSAAIYSLLKFDSPDFAEFLQKKGFKIDNKKFGLFSFALKFEEYKIIKDKILLKSPRAFLTISSPVVEEYTNTFLASYLGNRIFNLNCSGTKSTFLIEGIDKFHDPNFSDNMKFSALSPIVISALQEEDGKENIYYYRYSDNIEKFNEELNKDLIKKYEMVYNKAFTGSEIKLTWDTSYIGKRLAERKKVTMKQTIKENSPEQAEVVGNMSPFQITGNPELIRIGYECGFGEMNAWGFGLAKVIPPRDPNEEMMKNAYIFPKNRQDKKRTQNIQKR